MASLKALAKEEMLAQIEIHYSLAEREEPSYNVALLADTVAQRLWEAVQERLTTEHEQAEGLLNELKQDGADSWDIDAQEGALNGLDVALYAVREME